LHKKIILFTYFFRLYKQICFDVERFGFEFCKGAIMHLPGAN
jgi:signal-transduction protein with cAMP-binding, CBS, and nucleotidyltransferase domain